VEDRAVRLTPLASRALALAALLALAPGCGSARSRECREVVLRINESVKRNEEFEAERRTQRLESSQQTAKQMHTLSGIYQDLFDRLTAVPLTDKPLKIDVDAYAHQVKLAADGTNLLAAGIESNRPENARHGDEIYAKAVVEQKALVTKINTYCAP
jgi:hypothetical protein